MASGWRLQLCLVASGLIALVVAFDPASGGSTDAVPPTATELVREPSTSLVVLTTVAVTVPGGQVQDCVDYVQFGAFTGAADLSAMWDAAGHDVDRLRENCVSLGRGDPEALATLSERRRELDAYLSAASTTDAPDRPAPGGPG